MRSGAAIVCLCLATTAQAQDPVVVVVESQARSIGAEAVRESLEQQGVEVVSLLEPGAERIEETLTIAVQSDGRSATVHLRTPRGVEVRFLRAPSPRTTLARWLVSPITALLRAHRTVRRPAVEVLDPWDGQRTARTRPAAARPRPASGVRSEVLDPWARPVASAGPAAETPPIRPGTEVLDPWGGDTSAPEAPRELPTIEQVDRPEVVDPWEHPHGRERGDGLSRPRPRDQRPRDQRPRNQRR